MDFPSANVSRRGEGGVRKARLFLRKRSAMKLSDRISAWREERGWSQKELAAHLDVGVTTQTIGRYERGERIPDGDFLSAMVRLGCDPAWLLTGASAATARVEVDDELMGRVTDAIARLYKDERVSLAPVDLGRLAAQRYSEIVAATNDPAERYAMIKLVVQQLRQELHAKAAAPGTGTGKRSA